MRLIVFGATGRTGQLLVRQALDRGDEVTAYVRALSRWSLEHHHLRIIEGSFEETGKVVRALTGNEAMISTLGVGSGTLTKFAQVVVPQMVRLQIKRLVSLVGAATSDPADTPSIGRSFMITLMRVMAGGMLEDSNEHADLVRASSLDWTLVRPPRLTDGPVSRQLQSGPTLNLGPRDSISRADLAAFMLDVATSDLFVKQAPMVATKRG